MRLNRRSAQRPDALPRASHVRIDVFDLAGRRIRTLVDGDREPGVHAVPFEPGTSASSGVYFVRMSAGAFPSNTICVR